MADLGLIGGIADGFKEGLKSYQEQKQRNFNNRMLLAEMMSKGFQQDADGNVTPGEGLIAQQKAGLLKSKHDIGQYDTDINNPVTAGAYAATKQSLAASNPGQKFDLPSGLSAADLTGENGMYAKDVAGGYAKQAGQIKANGILAAAAPKNQSFADRDSTTVGKDYESRMQNYRQMQEDIRKIETTFSTKDKNGNPLVTSQQLGDANAAIARIYSPNHMSDSTVTRTEYESTPARFAAALQKLTTDPTDIGSKELVGHIIDQAHHLGNVGNKNALQELDSLDAGYGNLQVPAAAATQKQKSANMRQRYSTQYPEAGLIDPGQGFAPDVLNYAKTHNITPEAAQAVKMKRTGGQ